MRTGRWGRDLLLAIGVAVASFVFAAGFDLHERFAGWALRHESWDADELAFGLAVPRRRPSCGAASRPNATSAYCSRTTASWRRR
jgi:hypothetical protein